MAGPNTLLDNLLDEAGMSRQGLAVRINHAGAARGKRLRYDHTAVARWIRGQRPRKPTPDLICEVLGDQLGRPLTHADIGLDGASGGIDVAMPLDRFVSRATSMWRSDHLRRSEAHPPDILTGMDAVRPVWEWEDPTTQAQLSHRGDRRIGTNDVRFLLDARSHYEQMYRLAGGVTTHQRIAQFLTTSVTPMLYGEFTDPTGRELYRAAAGLAAVAGITAYDAEQHGVAQRYFHQALRLGKVSGDRAFGGYIIALLVNQSLALGDARQAITFATAALRTAGSAVSTALKADLHAMQGKAYAIIGDAPAARASIVEAQRAGENISGESEPAETGYIQPGLIEAQVTEALISLGDLKPAAELTEITLTAPTHPRGQVNRLATAATLSVRMGELDQAAQRASVMLDHAQGMDSGRLAQRFRKLRFTLTDHGSSSTRDVVDRLDRTLDLLG